MEQLKNLAKKIFLPVVMLGSAIAVLLTLFRRKSSSGESQTTAGEILSKKIEREREAVKGHREVLEKKDKEAVGELQEMVTQELQRQAADKVQPRPARTAEDSAKDMDKAW